MTDTELTCPNCGEAIPLTEALSAQIRTQLEADLAGTHLQALREAEERAARVAREAADAQLERLNSELELHSKRAREAEARELELAKRARDLEEAQRTAAERIRLEVEAQLRVEQDTRLETLVQEATKRARQETALELKLANEQLAEERRKRTEAEQHELSLRQQAAELEARARNLDLELARKLDLNRAEWEAGLRQSLGEEQSLKLKEKEKQIEDLRKVIDDLKRKSEQGSQELQGQVLELDIQGALEARFPQDVIKPVPAGARGADLIQQVRNGALRPCGSIIWETKNTKRWQPAWIGKLKEDQRAAGANLAVLVSVVLPEEVFEFGQLDGVWVASLRTWPALAVALREQLIGVAFAHAASEGKREKMELLYRYLASDQFRQRVQGIVEAFTGMQEQLARERRAMERIWREREKQIERVIDNTAGMYGEIRGIAGAGVPAIPALELDPEALLAVEVE
jgi:hypothetical protein